MTTQSGFLAAMMGAAAMALIALSAAPAHAQFNIGSILPGGSFTVDGRRGTYLSQVDPTRIDNRILQEEAQGLSAEGNSIAAFDGLRLPMPKTQAALNAMLARVDGPWPHDRPSMPQAHLIASGKYAPQTLPDGSIMVNMGLLINAATDDEVAYILAHELGHVRLGHFADDGAFRRKRQFATLIGQIYSSAIALSEARIQESGDNFRVMIDDERRVADERIRAAEANYALRQLMTLLVERPWSRAEEDQADALAYDLTTQAGYRSGDAANAVFSSLNAEYNLRIESARHIQETLSYAMRTAMTEENATAAVNGRIDSVLSGMRGPLMRVGRDRLLQTAVGYLGQRHRTPEARIKGIGDYAARAYAAGTPASELQTDWLDDLRSEPEFQDARTVVLALQASKALETTDLPGSLAALQPAMRTRFTGAPVVANAAARLYGLSGDVGQADRLYSIAHRSEDQSLQAFIEHAHLMAKNRRFDRARAVVTLGIERAGEGVDGEKPFLPVLVAISFRQSNDEEGLVYLQRCVGYEEDELRTACTVAALGQSDREEELTPEMEARINATVRVAEAQSTMGADVEGVIRGFGSLFGGS